MLSRTRTSIHALLNTLEHERHARGALLLAFADDLRSALPNHALESTGDLLASAERGEISEAEVTLLLTKLRSFAAAA